MEHKTFILPVSVITLHDISLLVAEVESIDAFFEQSKVRRSGTTMEPPRTSSMMEDVLQYNKLNLIRDEDRNKAKLALQAIRTKSPSLHISFSANAPREFLEKIIGQVRRDIHPQALLQVGLQPNIGAGFTLRTTNKFFDFSLRQHLVKTKSAFIDELIKAIPKPEIKNG
jgi:hypothetical protein